MKKASFLIAAIIVAIIATILLVTDQRDSAIVKTSEHEVASQPLNTKVDQMKLMIKKHAGQTTDEQNYVTYDHQEWTYFPEKRSENLVVIWPDGKQTIGLEKRREVFISLFAHAPDTKIIEHPTQHGSENKTGLSATITGTFSEPIITGNGKKIKPTGKTFSVPIYVVGVWENGVMVEEHLFWDDTDHKMQLGVIKNENKFLKYVKGLVVDSKENEITS